MHTRYRVIPMESISQLLVNESRHLADYRRYIAPLYICSPPDSAPMPPSSTYRQLKTM